MSESDGLAGLSSDLGPMASPWRQSLGSLRVRQGVMTELTFLVIVMTVRIRTHQCLANNKRSINGR